MALGNSDRMSCGLTHCRHFDRLLISSSLLPECPVNNGVEQYQTLSWILHMSAELKPACTNNGTYMNSKGPSSAGSLEFHPFLSMITSS